jgi:MoaA/NifB/PqqE/SkfB family radical SAM enzyme
MKIRVRVEPYGALVYIPEIPATVRLDRAEARRLLGYTGDFPDDLTAPEVVHLEISDRCNMNCPECYVRDKAGRELTTEQWKRIIEDLARSGVLQCTFGGGEPFMRRDIFELASFVNDHGMNVAVTTNGTLISDDDRLSLFKQINFSEHGNLEELKPRVEIARKYTRVGMNFVVRKSSLERLGRVADYCRARDLELLLLSFKPVSGWYEEVVAPEEIMRIALRLSALGTKVAVDGMTCGRCYAAQRFVDIDSLGNVLPCSFVRIPLGNALIEPFSKIWRAARIWRELNSGCPYHPGV